MLDIVIMDIVILVGSARQIRWFGGNCHQIFPFSHQKMLSFGLDMRGGG